MYTKKIDAYMCFVFKWIYCDIIYPLVNMQKKTMENRHAING